MCNFFSFVTEPVNHPGEKFYFDWEMRQSESDGADSHSHICAFYNLNEDNCNKYEYSPLTGRFFADGINSETDDSERAERWVKKLDFKNIIEPLLIKPIVNPLTIPAIEKVTEAHIRWLKDWAAVWDSVEDSVRASVWASVKASVGASVWASVWGSVGDSVEDSVWGSVGDSVRASVGAYVSSFLAINYAVDFKSGIDLWESGLVPSFDGKVWRLHTGTDARIVFEWMPE